MTEVMKDSERVRVCTECGGDCMIVSLSTVLDVLRGGDGGGERRWESVYVIAL